MEHEHADSLRARFPHVLITGSGGQLGVALAETFPWARALTRQQWDIRNDPGGLGDIDLVLHAAAWTKVDDAEENEGLAGAVNVSGTKRVVEIGAPVVYYSTDYVFDGTKRTPYLESDIPDPQSAYGRTKLAGEREIGDRGWIVRSSWLFGWTGHNFVRTMLKLGAERDEVSVVADQVGSPTYVGHLAEATRAIVELDPGLYHVAAEGECSWAEFASAIFEEAGLDCRVVPITTAELGRPAPRPAYSVLRSEKPETPRLPPWRDGLRACLDRLS